MNINTNRAIGVFDSGIGGLTVVRSLMERLPFENIIYFGDTARVPYGIKSVETINRYAAQITEFLIQERCKTFDCRLQHHGGGRPSDHCDLSKPVAAVASQKIVEQVPCWKSLTPAPAWPSKIPATNPSA